MSALMGFANGEPPRARVARVLASRPVSRASMNPPRLFPPQNGSSGVVILPLKPEEPSGRRCYRHY